jgi:hypothetical protein
MDEKELIKIVTVKASSEYGDVVNADNILAIMAIAMNVVEGRAGTITGPEKKTAVISIVKYIIIKSASPEKITKLLSYVDEYSDAGLELVIWLSRHTDIVKNINKSVCCRSFLNSN